MDLHEKFREDNDYIAIHKKKKKSLKNVSSLSDTHPPPFLMNSELLRFDEKCLTYVGF